MSATTKNDNESKNTLKRFRSLLPHEPLPQNESIGYIHLQGALTPKLRKEKKEKLNEDEKEDETNKKEAEKEEEKEAKITFLSKEKLESVILSYLTTFLNKNISRFQHLNNNTPAIISVQIENPSSSAKSKKDEKNVKDANNGTEYQINNNPYTKAKIICSSPLLARTLVSYYKHFATLTPHDLFSSFSKEEGGKNHWEFGKKPILMTQITSAPFPTLGEMEVCWKRSSPPKFRRLLFKGEEEEEETIKQRNNTRFVFLTGITPETETLSFDDDDDKLTLLQEYTNKDNHLLSDALRQSLSQFDSSNLGIELFFPSQKKKSDHGIFPKYCHVGMRTHEDAKTLMETLQNKCLELEFRMGGERVIKVKTGKLFFDYADMTQRSYTTAKKRGARSNKDDEEEERGPPKSECTSLTSSTVIPGLFLLSNYITTQMEEVLLAALTGPMAPWAPPQITPSGGVVNRRVQHYGYVFDYKSANVLRDRSCSSGEEGSRGDCPPLPSIQTRAKIKEWRNEKVEAYISKSAKEGRGWELLAGLIERTRRVDFQSLIMKGVKDCDLTLDWSNVADHNEDVVDDDHNEKDTITKEEHQTTSQKDSSVLKDCNTTYTHSSSDNGTYPHINQCTINEYSPGQGIGSHIDTISAFGDGLLSLSLGSGVVMEFRHQSTTAQKTKIGEDAKEEGKRKLVYLPPRSLLLMSKEARYEWEHMIVTRSTDTVDGIVMKRGTRVSLTLRTALSLGADNDDDNDDEEKEKLPPPMVRIESPLFPPRWGEVGSNNDHNNEKIFEKGPKKIIGKDVHLATPSTEKNHVHAVYDAIATQWHHTRGKRGVLWPGATQFLKSLPKGSMVADVGCGDGKYFPAIWESGSYVIGMDISVPLLKTAVGSCQGNVMVGREKSDGGGDEKNVDSTGEGKGPESRRIRNEKKALDSHPALVGADAMHVPIKDASCDAAICIAVMHHLSTVERRLQCLSELARIVKVGGTINVQAWAMEQEEGSRRRFAGDDVFVPFNAQPRYLDRVSRGGDDDARDILSSYKRKTKSTNAQEATTKEITTKGVAEMYSEAYDGAQFDERKGLVVFQRYCHLYRRDELESLALQIDGLELIESGFESGNHFLILKVVSH